MPATWTRSTSTRSGSKYFRAARELWKYCNLTDVEMTARHLYQDRSID